MRSKSKEPKHGSKNKEKSSINLSEKFKLFKTNISKKVSDMAATKSALKPKVVSNKLDIKSSGINYNKQIILSGAGVVFFLVTSIFSVCYAVESKQDTSINTAYSALDTNLIYDGVFIEEVNISGLTKEQAIRRGESDYARPRLSKTFTIAYGNYTKDVTYEDLGGSFDIKSVVDEAYKIGRSGSKKDRIAYTNNLSTSREYLVSSITIDKGALKDCLKSIANHLNSNSSSSYNDFDIDTMADELEKSMLIGEEDIIYNLSTKS